GLDAGPGEVGQEVRFEVAPDRGVGTLLVVTYAGVDEDRPALAAQQPGLDRGIDDVGLRFQEMRGQPVSTGFPDLLRTFGEESVGRHFDRTEVFPHPGDGYITKGDLVHGKSLGFAGFT